MIQMNPGTSHKEGFFAYIGEIWDDFELSGFKFELAFPLVIQKAESRGKDKVLARDALAVVEGYWLRGPGRRIQRGQHEKEIAEQMKKLSGDTVK